MPSLIDIRRRIRAVRSTQQITKAMKTVAASKLRRAQERILNARPFASQMLRVLNSVAARVDPSSHPLLATRETVADKRARTLLIVITADRGLCGSFNANTVRSAGGFIVENEAREVAVGLVGRKARDFFRRRGFEVRFELVGIFDRLRYEHAQEIAQAAIEEFVSGQVDSVYLVYNEFKSILQQRIVIERLLPIPRLDVESPEADARSRTGEAKPPAVTIDYLYEPAPEVIFRDLLPRHVEVQVYRALLESSAAEQAARMTAMDSATRNAGDMIDQLTLYMNKVRQAAITREIIEVVSGAAAL